MMNRVKILVLATLVGACSAPFAFCQPAALYKLTKEDLARMQERAEVLRTAGQPGWEPGYIALANAEWSSGERTNALSRFITTMRDTQDCEHRSSAFRASMRAINQAAHDHSDTKEYKQQLEDFSFHCKKILLEEPVTQASMAGNCAVDHAATLSSAAHFWENYDQGAAEKAAETMILVAGFMEPSGSADTKASAKLLLSRIFEKRGKYEAAYLAYEEAITHTNFAGLGADGTFVRETMMTEKMRLLALHQPGVASTRTSLATRALELRTVTLTWLQKTELFTSLLRPMQIEGMTTERIDGMIHFVHAAPTVQAASQEEEQALLDLLSSMQNADHASIGRPDAALLAYEVLIARSTVQADRDR